MFSLPASLDATKRDLELAERGTPRLEDVRFLSALFHSHRRFPVMGETEFRAGLKREQRRQERSGRPFVLVRITAPELFSDSRARKKVRNLLRAVANTARQTDIVGWLEASKVLGILCTELGEHGEVSAGGIILARMTRATRRVSVPGTVNGLDLSLELFSRPALSSGQALAQRGQLVS